MGVWETDTLENNFNEITKEIEKMKEITINKFKKLEESTGLTKIKQFLPLHLTSFKARLSEKRGSWNSQPILRVEWNDYKTDKHIKEKGLAKGIFFEENWHYVYVIFDENKQDNLEKMIAFINSVADSDLENHLENVKRQKINASTQEKLFNIFSEIGISTTYHGYKTSRSKDTTKMSYEFPSEIRKQIPTQYSESKLDDLKKSLTDQVKKIWDNEVNKIKAEKAAKAKQEKEKEHNKKLALLLAKYDMELEDTWSELLDVIVSKNKYLRLAHYLEENRNDWNDGYDFAEGGLSTFTIESELDKEIEDDITSHMYENWNGDGRVFRDCKYNYSVIYGIAAESDPQLYKDYEIVKEHVDSDH
ncbi:hypothetical protein [Paenibacillus tianjinensis]|uniref:Uncharacterized protein n=1 Tax=Paenibacillus tianjinensis TaxID=2810347 RepID=A0ABX7L8T5_9BACL|nr:hypothetical protein [Paenibacillus tianjinensis]QSF43444.1 hypothetical protein JRJ22_19465 [Paenibacillus tianjinensis]